MASACCCMRAIAVRATEMLRYAPDPAAATPSVPFRKPITIRSDEACRVKLRCAPAVAARAKRDARENVAPNGSTPLDVTVPLIVAPLLATNETDAPVI